MKTPSRSAIAIGIAAAFTLALPGFALALPKDVIEGFEKFVQESPDFTPEVKAGALEGIDETSRSLAPALRKLYPEFGDANLRILDPNDAGAAQMLEGMVQGDNRFLAAEALFALGRAQYLRKDYEAAAATMKRLRADFADASVREQDALYFQALSLGNTLRREEAREALNEFLNKYPGAPKRQKDEATDRLNAIGSTEEGSLDDVSDHMRFSGSKLRAEDPGERTQEVQGKIVEMLEKLIEESQNDDSGGGGGGGGQSGSQGQSGSGQGAGQQNADQGNAQAASPPNAVRRIRGATKSAWDDLRKKEREAEAMGALENKVPPRYRGLIEQYFQDLQKGAAAGE